MKYNNVIGCHLYSLGELICATGVCYCIRVVMSKHHMKGLVILVVLYVPHWLWHHNVIGVFIWHEWHLAPVIFPSSWLCSLVWLSPKLFTEVWVDDLSHFVRTFLVSGNKTSQLIDLLCDNKDTRAQGHKPLSRQDLQVLSHVIIMCFYYVTGIKFCDLIMPQCDFCPPVYIFKLIWKKL